MNTLYGVSVLWELVEQEWSNEPFALGIRSCSRSSPGIDPFSAVFSSSRRFPFLFQRALVHL